MCLDSGNFLNVAYVGFSYDMLLCPIGPLEICKEVL